MELSRYLQYKPCVSSHASEVAFFSSYDSRLAIFQLVACVPEVFSNREKTTFTRERRGNNIDEPGD